MSLVLLPPHKFIGCHVERELNYTKMSLVLWHGVHAEFHEDQPTSIYITDGQAGKHAAC